MIRSISCQGWPPRDCSQPLQTLLASAVILVLVWTNIIDTQTLVWLRFSDLSQRVDEIPDYHSYLKTSHINACIVLGSLSKSTPLAIPAQPSLN